MAPLFMSISDIQEICSREKPEGRLLLAKALNLYPFDELDDLQSAIYIDYLYDNIAFAAEKGFPWNQIQAVLAFADVLLQKAKGKSLTEVIGIFKSQAETVAPQFGERNFKVYTDFVFSTFMTHYQLFQYVFTKRQAQMIPHISMEVEIPPDPQEMKNAKRLDVWEYEQTIHDMDVKECERVNEKLLLKEKVTEEWNHEKETTIEKVSEVDQPITKECLKEIIQDVLQTYTSVTVENIKSTVQDIQEEIEFKLAKTSYPRPQVLGPPPRYKLKTPLSSGRMLNTAGRDKSRSSSRNSPDKSKSAKSPTS